MTSRHRSSLAGAAALSAVLLLSGCGLISQIQASTPTPAVTSASPTPKPTMAAPELEVGAVVATGHLAGDPLVAGDVEVVVARAGAFELRLLDFRSDHPGEIAIGLSPRTVDPGTRCTSSIMTMDYGDPFQYTELAFPLDPDFTDGDPTFLRTVLVKLYDPEAFADGCYISVLSSAILHWTLPDMRPGLVVVDSGKTGGATGEVTIVDGEPVSYTVAPNDMATEVAARFGITVDDLFYLNPVRTTFIKYPLLQLGEVLNISKSHR